MPKASTKFGDACAFNMLTSEMINDRLAMVGFIAAMGVEIWRVWEKFEANGNFMRMVVRMVDRWGGGTCGVCFSCKKLGLWCSLEVHDVGTIETCMENGFE